MRNVLKKWEVIGIFAMLSILFLVGCGTGDAPVESAESEDVEEASEQLETGKDEAFPVTFTDFVDREVTIETQPETVISVQASTTEVLFALGVDDMLIGVSDYDNYPEEALEIQSVGAQDMDVELVLTLLPDVIFVTDYHYNSHPDILEQYEEVGIQVVITGSGSSFDEAYEGIEMIGAATGTLAEAQSITGDMKERLNAIKETAEAEVTEKKKVWIEVSPDPDIFTTGSNTFMHEMLESIQAENVAGGEEGWVSYTEEEAVTLNPDVIITTYGDYVDDPAAEVYGRDGWQEVTAVKEEQVFDVDNDTVTRPGPRLIQGVETLAQFIYPEVFGE